MRVRELPVTASPTPCWSIVNLQLVARFRLSVGEVGLAVTGSSLSLIDIFLLPLENFLN